MSDKGRFFNEEQNSRKAIYMGMDKEEVACLAVRLKDQIDRLHAYTDRIEEAVKSLMLSENDVTQKDIALAIENHKDLVHLLFEAADWTPTGYSRGDASVGQSAGYESAECLTPSVASIMEYLPDAINQQLIDMACEE